MNRWLAVLLTVGACSRAAESPPQPQEDRALRILKDEVDRTAQGGTFSRDDLANLAVRDEGPSVLQLRAAPLALREIDIALDKIETMHSVKVGNVALTSPGLYVRVTLQLRSKHSAPILLDLNRVQLEQSGETFSTDPLAQRAGARTTIVRPSETPSATLYFDVPQSIVKPGLVLSFPPGAVGPESGKLVLQ